MKTLFSSILALAMGVTASVAQIPGMMSMPSAQPLEGTSLGANETIAYDGIALGNRVKLRGYVDFIYGYGDLDDVGDDSRFSTAGDVDFLVDFSPVTGEVHLAYASGASQPISLEQAFGRYSFNQDFNISFGRQLTNLGYEADEAPGLYATSYGYFADVVRNHSAFDSLLAGLPTLRRNYVDGVRANFNNGQFGLSLGIHDGYWLNDDFNDNVAIDIAASVMIVPGLEARLGYAHQDMDTSDIGQFNTWLAYNPGDLTLALEFDYFDFDGDSDLWDIMLLGNYQFTDFFGLTLRYSHEDAENLVGNDYVSDRITLAFLFSITQQFGINFEYSHTEIEIGSEDSDADEIYLEGLYTF
ncbi:MAG: hypothetical protein CMI19_05425 [Opitutae bacterium]|nr:hypothetical protein [Opitutae bacterium]|tara:strand:- start:34 stop:1101 length:1068 start_codon:yes stop_codon:yes gene_type:complete